MEEFERDVQEMRAKYDLEASVESKDAKDELWKDFERRLAHDKEVLSLKLGRLK